LIGVSLGALVTYVLLWWNHVDMAVAGTAVVVGAIASFFWPIVAGFFLARRVKQRRDDAMQAEVAKQVAAQTKPPA
jgi:uncharacterized protein YgiB involved in biofilm formation